MQDADINKDMIIMKIAILAPICRDEVIIGDDIFHQPGGVAYYTGNALSALGIDVTVFGIFGDEPESFTDEIKVNRIVHIRSDETIRFINEYPDKKNPDHRIQKAKIYPNTIRYQDIEEHDFSVFDLVIFGPFFHDNFEIDIFRKLYGKSKIILASQGLIRYLDSGKIVWKRIVAENSFQSESVHKRP